MVVLRACFSSHFFLSSACGIGSISLPNLASRVLEVVVAAVVVLVVVEWWWCSGGGGVVVG